ncbi:MAG TPA: C-type lectin domain-containing protein [Polyangiaceae bacterium]|nr:C-type lectin domain-containing protein [Polyangiaceae bacterium]
MSRLVACLPVLVVFGCWGPQDSALFSSESAQNSLAGVASSGGASATAGSTSLNGGNAGAGASDSQATAGGGSTGYPAAGNGGAALGGGGGASSVAGTALTPTEGGEASGGSGHPPTPEPSCGSIEGSVSNEDNGHCYRVNLDELDFADARDACKSAGGHLVTITSESENAFVGALLTTEHWLGATDNRADDAEGVGSYAWVNDEPWDYSDWQDGQPNALKTDCPKQSNYSSCFEHCGYQTDKADWIDRSCWHTIASVCEWELDAPSSADPTL